MSAAILFDPRLHVMLFRIDSEVADEVQGKGCKCGGPLDVANYPRKPRAPGNLGPEYSKRFSFCCRRCRRRATPVSVRFLGRRVHLFPVVVLGTALSAGISRSRLAVLRKELGVDRRTLERWRTWWREVFPRVRSCFSPPIDGSGPHSLVVRVTSGLHALIDVLRVLAPIGRAP